MLPAALASVAQHVPPSLPRNDANAVPKFVCDNLSPAWCSRVKPSNRVCIQKDTCLSCKDLGLGCTIPECCLALRCRCARAQWR